ncbi:pilus assembly protein [Glycomyces sp. L485]|uniref:TadE/TadG family type IV pilus assembly protein n=1 Tax=Glycomyces sp. L485 TaxID=2909235 RepID=UPI001F4A0EF5|nr:TadE/TadG family type IV pilus assembly protein [Glycomyces sp. L485]MCH7229933.1 pilus assembly protein [Glycomyces sp. L485]
MNRNRERPWHDEGSSAVETVLIMPFPIFLLLFTVVVTKLVGVDIDVTQAAYHAARDASLQRGASEAVAAAQNTAEASLPDCTSLDVDVDLEDFAPGDTVTVTLTCDVPILGVPGFEGTTQTLTATGTAHIDTWRADL